MLYQTLNKFYKESHPWEPYIPPNADKLLLGTFPTIKRNRKIEFYYPNPSNKFWHALTAISNSQTTHYFQENCIEERKTILKSLNLGITDIGKMVLRQGESSEDSSLFPIEYTDVFSLLESHRSLNTIIITSKSGPNSALAWFNNYCILNNTPPIKCKTKSPIPFFDKLLLNRKEYKVVVAPSTSSRSSKSFEEIVEIYKHVLW